MGEQRTGAGINALVDPADIAAIVHGRHGNPFSVLGMHGGGDTPITVRAFVPRAQSVAVRDKKSGRQVAVLERLDREGFFAAVVGRRKNHFAYQLEITDDRSSWSQEDPYRFPPLLGELDIHLIAEGRHWKLYEKLGAHRHEVGGVVGVRFAIWAPNASRVSVVGEFNNWDGRCHPMRKRIEVGVWELFLPDVASGQNYKFEILSGAGDRLPLKADPVSFEQEHPPQTASKVHGLPERDWDDSRWMKSRHQRHDTSAAISIYEVHLGSWRRGQANALLDYETLGDLLIPYVKELGFTHIELLPINEHPFAGSWGYQPIGLFAPTSRFGRPEEFSRFVDRCHAESLGVVLDWVPAHFPTDEHGLSRFDGTALYEHEDPRIGFHRDWNTLIYNYGRKEVANFLQANAIFWLDRYHIDALRVDAVASMLYLDYSRKPGDWIPNKYGGNENLDAIAFLREANARIFSEFEGATTIAEESTAWPQVTRPVDAGGLGFGYKWNMGWMHDTLSYMSHDPIHRRHHQHSLTFGIDYAFSENFVLPLSHDEVVHGKRSLIGRMPGNRREQFSNLRAYYGFMWAHPGKKLLFMGGEFAQEKEWNHDRSLDWHLLNDPAHKGVQTLIHDLNHLYRSTPALHKRDCDAGGFEWIDASDTVNSVISFLRKGHDDGDPVLVVCNFTPIERQSYRIGVPIAGSWSEVLNTDSAYYGGSNVGNFGNVIASERPCHGRPASLEISLPPLATLILRRTTMIKT